MGLFGPQRPGASELAPAAVKPTPSAGPGARAAPASIWTTRTRLTTTVGRVSLLRAWLTCAESKTTTEETGRRGCCRPTRTRSLGDELPQYAPFFHGPSAAGRPRAAHKQGPSRAGHSQLVAQAARAAMCSSVRKGFDANRILVGHEGFRIRSLNVLGNLNIWDIYFMAHRRILCGLSLSVAC